MKAAAYGAEQAGGVKELTDTEQAAEKAIAPGPSPVGTYTILASCLQPLQAD